MFECADVVEYIGDVDHFVIDERPIRHAMVIEAASGDHPMVMVRIFEGEPIGPTMVVEPSEMANYRKVIKACPEAISRAQALMA